MTRFLLIPATPVLNAGSAVPFSTFREVVRYLDRRWPTSSVSPNWSAPGAIHRELEGLPPSTAAGAVEVRDGIRSAILLALPRHEGADLTGQPFISAHAWDRESASSPSVFH